MATHDSSSQTTWKLAPSSATQGATSTKSQPITDNSGSGTTSGPPFSFWPSSRRGGR